MRLWPTMMTAGAPSNSPSRVGRGANKEGGMKATIGGGEGEWAQKWGCNDDDNKYSANKVASASQMIRQSTMTITTAARRGSGQ